MGAEIQETKTVTILLTKYFGIFGRFICGISKYHYSHASVSIDEDEEIFYSFNTKGFVIEKPNPHKFENRYFCSQFVAEILSQAGAIELKKKESLYLPGQLIDGIECLFGAKQLVYDII